MNKTQRGLLILIGVIVFVGVFCFWIPFILLPGAGIGVALPVISVPGEILIRNWLGDGFHLTNTLVGTALTDVIIVLILIALYIGGGVRAVPKRLQAVLERLHAAEALVGRAAGAGQRAGLLLAVQRTRRWSLGMAIAFMLFFWVAGTQLIDVLTGLDSVREQARIYLPWLILSPLISFWSFLYDGVYVGLTRSREMMLVMVGSTLALFLPAWYLLSQFGNHALWFAFILFMAGRGIGMHVWFQRLMAGGGTGLPAIRE